MTSPVVVFGRAMLLGLTVQGDPGTCYSAYPSCPRDPNRLVDYLNNHRGGLFRFFSATGLPAYYTQQYSQARIQTPYQRLPMPQTGLRPPRVTINSDQGHRHLLPQRKVLTHKTLPPNRPSLDLQKPLTFPGDTGRLYNAQQGEDPILEDAPRREQHFAFPDRARTEEPSTESYPSPINPSIHRLPPPVAVQLPDRTGTGDLRIDNDENTYGPSSFPSRYRRDVRGSNSPNTLKQRMVFPLNDEHHNKAANKMRFPSDTHEKSINFPSSSQSTRDGYRKLNDFNIPVASNEQPLWDKSKDGVTTELVNFPKYTNERHEPKRHSMKFPSDNNDDHDAAKVSLILEPSKNTKSSRGMKFPVEYADQNEKSESSHLITKDHNDISKVRFENVQEGFGETSSRMIFPDTGSKEASDVAKTSFNLHTSKNKSTRRMKFPVEYSDQREKSESSHITSKDHYDISKVRFGNVQEGFGESSSYGITFPYNKVKDSSNVVRFLET